MTNEDLVAQYKTTEDLKLINDLIIKNEALIQRILHNGRCPQNMWDDAAQEIRLMFTKAAQKYNVSKSAFSTFVYKIGMNKLQGYIKKNKSPFGSLDEVKNFPARGPSLYRGDIVYYLSKLPECHSRIVMQDALCGLTTHGERTRRGYAYNAIRRLIKKE